MFSRAHNTTAPTPRLVERFAFASNVIKIPFLIKNKTISIVIDQPQMHQEVQFLGIYPQIITYN